MSLVCHECNQVMQPGESLPGREGIFVRPKVSAYIWNPDSQEDTSKWLLRDVPACVSRSLCFECIVTKLPEERTPLLGAVYEAFEAEMLWRGIDLSRKKRWCDGNDARRWLDANDAFRKKLQAIDQKSCLLCGQPTATPPKSIFVARCIDRVASSQELGGLPGEHNYQFSTVESGCTSFVICFDCFGLNFPRTFSQLSYDLQGLDDSTLPPGQNKVTVTPEVYAMLVEELGEEEVRRTLREIGAEVGPLPGFRLTDDLE